jgi:uncharacterized membrane protein (DUF106 family)
MTEQEKAQMYGDLLNSHTRIGNQISEIKGESIDLSEQQLKKIKELQDKQIQIMNSINNLLK